MWHSKISQLSKLFRVSVIQILHTWACFEALDILHLDELSWRFYDFWIRFRRRMKFQYSYSTNNTFWDSLGSYEFLHNNLPISHLLQVPRTGNQYFVGCQVTNISHATLAMWSSPRSFVVISKIIDLTFLEITRHPVIRISREKKTLILHQRRKAE